MEILSITLSLLSLLYVVASTPVKGVGRFLAPDTMAATMLVAIFGVRPLFDDRFEGGAWYGRYVPSAEGETLSLLVGVLATVGLALGALATQGKVAHMAKRGNNHTGQSQHKVYFTAKRVLVTSLVSTLAYIIMLTALAGPSIFRQLSRGRSSDLQLGGIPEIVMMTPMTASLSVAIFLLAHRHRKLLGHEIVILLTAATSSLILFAQLGNRRFIIPAILIPAIAALVRKPMRVKLWHIAIAAVGIVLLAIIPMVRAAGARRPGEGLLAAAWRYLQNEGILGTIRPIFVSYDTEMFDYVAVAAPALEKLGFGVGRGTLVEFITRPLPERLAPTQAWSDVVLTELFGGKCGDPFCPVASYPGVLYFEGGLAIVAIGSFAAGMFLRTIASKLQHNGALNLPTLMNTVIISAFALVAIRTNTVHAAWWILYTIAISYAICYINTLFSISRKVPSRHPNATSRQIRSAPTPSHQNKVSR